MKNKRDYDSIIKELKGTTLENKIKERAMMRKAESSPGFALREQHLRRDFSHSNSHGNQRYNINTIKEENEEHK